MAKIFLSYRRSDSSAIAGRIFDRLCREYGHKSVIMDIDSIPPGVDFRHYVCDAVRSSGVLLALVGENWLGTGPGGKNALNQANDFVRIEIETALNAKINVIPVLLGTTPMPSVKDLPPSIQEFAYRNAIRVDLGKDFHIHMSRLVRHLQKISSLPGVILQSKPLAPPPAPVKAIAGLKPPAAAQPRARRAIPWTSLGLLLGHALWTGFMSALAGLAVAACVFWLTVAGLLMLNKPVNNSPLESNRSGLLAKVNVQPPLPTGLVVPPKDSSFRDYFAFVVTKQTATSLVSWFVLLSWSGVLMIFWCGLLPRLVTRQWAKLLEGLSLALTLAIVSMWWFRQDVGEVERLLTYGFLTWAYLLWMPLRGFRFRFLLYLLIVVLLGELKGSSIPTEYPATAIWYSSLALFAPASFWYLGVRGYPSEEEEDRDVEPAARKARPKSRPQKKLETQKPLDKKAEVQRSVSVPPSEVILLAEEIPPGRKTASRLEEVERKLDEKRKHHGGVFTTIIIGTCIVLVILLVTSFFWDALFNK